MKILVDTNILIDLLAQREPYFENAKAVISLCKSKKVKGCLAAHSFMDMFYILRKNFSVSERRELLKDFCKFLEVVGVDRSKIIAALDNEEFQDFEDCIQAECAKEFSADYIITRNVKDFQDSKVPAITPEDFLKMKS